MKLFKLLFSRAGFVTLFILVQIAFTALILLNLQNLYLPVTLIFLLLEVIIFIKISNKDMNPSQQVLWLALIVVFPLLGFILYFFFGESRYNRKNKAKIYQINKKLRNYHLGAHVKVPKHALQSNYIFNTLHYPAFQKTATKYYPSGEDYFKDLIVDLKNAKRFIFIEMYIIQQGKMWEEILEILKQKVKESVEVKVLYDDIGTIYTLPNNYNKKLIKLGIQAIKFNKYNPVLTIAHNNRNHRKTIIIDGNIAYCGGINIADKYINLNKSKVYWKDSAQRIEGLAVKSFTLSFLNICEHHDKSIDYTKYLKAKPAESDGYVQPFATGPKPFYNDAYALNIILNMINQANKSIKIMTPYFVPDYQLLNALAIAKARGVDVSIVIPDIPDKKTVYMITKYNSLNLLKKGIKIYKYKGAFVHAKSILVDDEVGIIGSINLDFRSFIHNFECGIWQYKTTAIKQLGEDYNKIFRQNKFLEEKDLKTSIGTRIFAGVLKIFYPIF